MPDDEPSAAKTTQDVILEPTLSVEGTDDGSANAPKVEDAKPSASNIDISFSRSPQDHARQEHFRPPLPPRPTNLSLFQVEKGPKDPLPRTTSSSAQQLQSSATTAISRTEISAHSYQDGSRETFATASESTHPQKSNQIFGSIQRMKGLARSEGGDTSSIRSFAPTLGRGTDNESLLGDIFGDSREVPAWKLFGHESDDGKPSETFLDEENELGADFHREFDSIGGPSGNEASEGEYIHNESFRLTNLL